MNQVCSMLSSDAGADKAESDKGCYGLDSIEKFYGLADGVCENGVFPDFAKSLSYQTRSSFQFMAAVAKTLLLQNAQANSEVASLNLSELVRVAHTTHRVATICTDEGKGSDFGTFFGTFKAKFQQWSFAHVALLVPRILELGRAELSKRQEAAKADAKVLDNPLPQQLTSVFETVTEIEWMTQGEVFQSVSTFLAEVKAERDQKACSMTEEERNLWSTIGEKLDALKALVVGWPLSHLQDSSLPALQKELEPIQTRDIGTAYKNLRDGWLEAKKSNVFDKVFDGDKQSEIEGAFKIVRVILACKSGQGHL